MNRAVQRLLWGFLVLTGASNLLSGQQEPLQQERWRQCKSGDPAQAIVACSELIGAGNMADDTLSEADAFYNRGRAYAHKRDYDRAIQDYTQAARLRPSDPNVFDGLGSAYWHKGDYDRTIENYDQALRLRPLDDGALVGRGLAYWAERDYDRAIQDYDQIGRAHV